MYIFMESEGVNVFRFNINLEFGFCTYFMDSDVQMLNAKQQKILCRKDLHYFDYFWVWLGMGVNNG